MYEAIATRPGVAQDVVELRSVVLGLHKQGMARIRMLASTFNLSDLVTRVVCETQLAISD